MQPGHRVTPGKWSIPRTAGGSSADKLEHLWSESPDNTNMMATVNVSMETFHMQTILCILDYDRYYRNLTPFI